MMRKVAYTFLLAGLLALNILLAQDLSVALKGVGDGLFKSAWWSYFEPVATGDDYADFLRTVEPREIWHGQLLGLSIGLAAREVAGGVPAAVVIPDDPHSLSSAFFDAAGDIPDPWYLRTSVANRVVAEPYDSVLDAEFLADMSEFDVVDMSSGVFAVRLDRDSSERVVVYTDAAHTKVYVLPESVGLSMGAR